MAKRISVKGKGADIFFGDYPEGGTPATPITETHGAEVSLQPTDTIPATDSRKQERLQESKKARMLARKQESSSRQQSPPSPLAEDVINAVWNHVAEKATITNAFRYTDKELTTLNDALYEVTKRHGVKLTKQDIARLGLNIVLWDYKLRGDASLLAGFVVKRKPQRTESL